MLVQPQGAGQGRVRQSQLIESDFTLTGAKLVAALEGVATRIGYPKMVSVDSESDLVSMALDDWTYENGVKLDCIRPGKLVENAVIESVIGRLRDECLNTRVILSRQDASQKIEPWRF